MNSLRTGWPVIAALFVSSQAAAQSDDARVWVSKDENVEVELVQKRNAEVDRALADAERRMAEAARQIAELSNERLPTIADFRKRIEIVASDKPRLGVTIGGGQKDGAVKGVPISGVTPGTAAAEAGLRAGDIITSINGESLGAPSAEQATERLLDFMHGVESGDSLQLGYLRDGKSGEVEVEPKPVEPQVFAFAGDGRGFRVPAVPGFESFPQAPGAPHPMVFHWSSDGWGDMELVELNEGLGRYFGTDEGLLVVTAPETTALQLQDGDVIQKIDGREPTSVRHALRILGSYQAGESLQLEIMRDKKRRTLDVEIPDDLSSKVMPRLAAPVVAPVSEPTPPSAARPVRPATKT
jgi:C-terminal processing protease CtpA/Prc